MPGWPGISQGLCREGTSLDGIGRLFKRLGIEPRNMAIYEKAFTHVSVPDHHSDSYENLEFLGDAVVGVVVAEYLVRALGEESVGRLTRLRSLAVSRKSLGAVARELGFEEHIRIEHSKIRDKAGIEDSVLSDCFESVVGAIYLDRGMRAAKGFTLRHLKPVINEAINTGELVDHKSRLQEYLQHRFKQIPRYRKVKAVGPDHARIFTVECIFRGKVLSRGRGTSLKRAEQDAARKALKQYRKKA
jgi:ribonuclease-3